MNRKQAASRVAEALYHSGMAKEAADLRAVDLVVGLDALGLLKLEEPAPPSFLTVPAAGGSLVIVSEDAMVAKLRGLGYRVNRPVTD